MKKKILIIVGALVALVVISVVVLVANLDRIVNSRKDALLAQAEARIGRDISVGDVGVAIWPEIGVQVKDVTISDDPAYSSDPFVRVADLRVNVALMPLLKKQVEIKRFVLNDPEIVVIKGEGGRFNFTGMVEAAGAAGGGGAAGAAKAPSNAAAVPFVLAFADIANGVVHYTDPAAGIDRTVRDIDFSASNVSLDSRIDATLAAAVFGETQDVKITASVGPVGVVAKPEDLAGAPLSATIEFGPASLADMTPPARDAAASPPPDGTLELKATLSGTVGAAIFDEIAASIAMFGARDPNIRVSATAGPFNFLADSTEVFAAARVKGNAAIGPVPLDELELKSADPSRPAPEVGGEIEGTVAFEGAMAALAFTAHVDAGRVSYTVPNAFAKPAGTVATVDAQGTFRPEGMENAGIEFSSIDAVVHALKVRGSGRFVPFKGQESMAFVFDGATAIGPWKDMMPAMTAFAPTGDVTFKMNVSGKPVPGSEPEIRGAATFSNVTATLPQVPNPLSAGKGTATFTAKSARVETATFTIGKSAFNVSADIPSFTPMSASYTVTSAEIWRADVQAPAPNAPALPRPEVFRTVSVTGKSAEIAGAAPGPNGAKPLQSDLDISSKSGIASNIDYTDAVAKVRATPEKVFIDSFSAKALGGSISGSGTFLPAESKFDITTKVQDMNLAEYFRYKSPALADAVSGRISGDLQLSGAGKTWEDLQKTLAGKGGAVVIEGALLNVNVTKQLFSSIQGMPMVPADLTAKMAAKNPTLFNSNKTVFQNLAGNITISDGKIQVPDLKIASSDFGLKGGGWFSFGKDMNMSTTFTLSDKLTTDLIAQVPAAKYLLTEGGKLEVPLNLTGAVMKPNVAVDASALSSRLQSSLMQEGKSGLTNQLKGLLGGEKKKD